ncbi:UPF0056 inner membrane protein [Desulfuromonas versatilis]|uniref:UPF0056 membrane protein n=1 Tax=Desulfuromonas versatilis TaxID=2802975 RepID=A0ABM8HMJ1_9BACT|nr:MarC family protein [Desulfuromonas versatilis]BCR03523.1 UPF0056 inner membrane protein [Desulfuromonas versatilis]
MQLETFLHALTSYFVIIDPIGAAVIFHGLSDGEERRYAIRMAIRATVISIAIVLVFGFCGEALLTRLGITIDALRVSGGLLLFYTAFNMITRQGGSGYSKSGYTLDISVFPMSIPLIAGPGCLTLTILLFSQVEGRVALLSLVPAVLLIYLLTLAMLLAARYLKKVIGKTGDDILQRLLGVILAALAIQFIADGIRGIAG